MQTDERHTREMITRPRPSLHPPASARPSPPTPYRNSALLAWAGERGRRSATRLGQTRQIVGQMIRLDDFTVSSSRDYPGEMEYSNRWIDFLFEINQDKFRQDEINIIGALDFHSTSIFPRLDVGPHPCSARQRGKSVDSRRGSNSREEVHQPIQPALRARRPLAPFMSVRGHEMATKRSRAARTSRNNAPSPSLLLFVAGGRSWMWACSSSD